MVKKAMNMLKVIGLILGLMAATSFAFLPRCSDSSIRVMVTSLCVTASSITTALIFDIKMFTRVSALAAGTILYMLLAVRPATCDNFEAWRQPVSFDYGTSIILLQFCAFVWAVGFGMVSRSHSLQAVPVALSLVALAILPVTARPVGGWLLERALLLAAVVAPWRTETAFAALGIMLAATMQHLSSGLALSTLLIFGAAAHTALAPNSLKATPIFGALFTMTCIGSLQQAGRYGDLTVTLAPPFDDPLTRSFRMIAAYCTAAVWGALPEYWEPSDPFVYVVASVFALMVFGNVPIISDISQAAFVVSLHMLALRHLFDDACMLLFGSVVASGIRYVLRATVDVNVTLALLDLSLIMLPAALSQRATATNRRQHLTYRSTLAAFSVIIVGTFLLLARNPLHSNFDGVPFCASDEGTKVVPRSLDELREVILKHSHVRLVGGGASWNGFSCPSPTLPSRCAVNKTTPRTRVIVDTHGLSNMRLTENHTLLCEAGASMGQVSAFLATKNLQLARTWWHGVTCGGAVASGVTQGFDIESVVFSVTCMLADGTLEKWTRAEEEFFVLFRSVGMFAAIVEVEFATVPFGSSGRTTEAEQIRDIGDVMSWVVSERSDKARLVLSAGDFLVHTERWHLNSPVARRRMSANGEAHGFRGTSPVVSRLCVPLTKIVYSLPFQFLYLPSVLAHGATVAIDYPEPSTQHSKSGHSNSPSHNLFSLNLVQIEIEVEEANLRACIEAAMERSVTEPVVLLKRRYQTSPTSVKKFKTGVGVEISYALSTLRYVDIDRLDAQCVPFQSHPGKATIQYMRLAQEGNVGAIVDWRSYFTSSQRQKLLQMMRLHDPSCKFAPQGLSE